MANGNNLGKHGKHAKPSREDIFEDDLFDADATRRLSQRDLDNGFGQASTRADFASAPTSQFGQYEDAAAFDEYYEQAFNGKTVRFDASSGVGAGRDSFSQSAAQTSAYGGSHRYNPGVTQQFDSYQAAQYGQGNGAGYGQTYGSGYDSDYGSSYGSSYGSGYSSDYSSGYDSSYGSDYGSAYGQAYGDGRYTQSQGGANPYKTQVYSQGFGSYGGANSYSGASSYRSADSYGGAYNNTYQQGYSNASYVNNGPNAQIVGQAEPREFDMEPKRGRRKRSGKSRTRKAARAVSNGAGNMAQSARGNRRSSRKRSGCFGRVLKTLLTLLLIICIPLGIYGYMLDRNLALPEDVRQEVNEVLTPASPFKPFYVLVLGSDWRENSGTSNFEANTGDNQRSDVILLIRVDPLKDQMTLVSVPRDTPYRDADGNLEKINETYNQGGPAATIKAVESLTGVSINHYAEVGFSDLEGIVDVLGGVTVDVDTELSYTDALTGEYVSIESGTQVLNGQQAQIFARARHEYSGNQDMNRQNNVRRLFDAILNGIVTKPFYEIPGTVLEVAKYINTDMKSYNFALMGFQMFINPGSTTMYSCTGPYDGEIDEETGLWLCYENPDGWANLIQVVESGEDPSSVDLGY